jgi:hypothetical protein
MLTCAAPKVPKNDGSRWIRVFRRLSPAATFARNATAAIEKMTFTSVHLMAHRSSGFANSGHYRLHPSPLFNAKISMANQPQLQPCFVLLKFQ